MQQIPSDTRDDTPGVLPETDLAALIGSRICHDLVSPIGAIGNGVELLLMEGAAQSPELALISESVAHANARIRFFRVSLGAASPGQRIARAEVIQILADLTRGGRLTVEWQSPVELARAEVKLAFLAIMACETAMAFGGRITVSSDDGAWTVTGQAMRLRADPVLWGPLVAGTPPAPGIGPAQVQFALLPDAAARLGRTLRATTEATGITLRF